MNTVILRTVQNLSDLKHFYGSTVLTVFNIQLERARLSVTPNQRKVAIKKLYQVLSRLGYRKHVGENQTVQLTRSI